MSKNLRDEREGAVPGVQSCAEFQVHGAKAKHLWSESVQACWRHSQEAVWLEPRGREGRDEVQLLRALQAIRKTLAFTVKKRVATALWVCK